MITHRNRCQFNSMITQHNVKPLTKEPLTTKSTPWLKSLERYNRNKRDANKKTENYQPIKAGDMVWLSSNNVTVPAKAILHSQKLTPRFFGPYQVERFDAPATVKLKWTNNKSKVWASRTSVFLISQAEPLDLGILAGQAGGIKKSKVWISKPLFF